MATFINAEKAGRFWVKDPDGGISIGTEDQIKSLNLQPATQEEVNKALEYERNAKKYEGIVGEFRAGGEAAVRSIPFIGDYILEAADIPEEQQRVGMEVAPVCSLIGNFMLVFLLIFLVIKWFAFAKYNQSHNKLIKKENNQLSNSCEGKVVEIDGKKYKLTEV